MTVTIKNLRIASEMLSRCRPLAEVEQRAKDNTVQWINDEILFREREMRIRALSRKKKISVPDARKIINKNESKEAKDAKP